MTTTANLQMTKTDGKPSVTLTEAKDLHSKLSKRKRHHNHIAAKTKKYTRGDAYSLTGVSRVLSYKPTSKVMRQVILWALGDILKVEVVDDIDHRSNVGTNGHVKQSQG